MREFVHFEVDQHVATRRNVVKHEVDIEMLVSQGDSFLPRHERIAAPQFQQKMLQLTDQHLLKVAFKKMFALLNAKKLKDKRVVDNFAGLQGLWGRLLYLCPYRIFVAACQHTLIIHRIDLAFQLARAPVCSDALLQIIVAGDFILHGQQCSPMRPTQLVTQCVTFWVEEVELPHNL